MSTHLVELFDSNQWVSQAEAARLRGVSRQAIAKLARAGRVRTLKVAGHVLVNRYDIETFQPAKPGRPRKND